MPATIPVEVHEQALTRLSFAGAIHGEHVVIFSKILDLNYETDRKRIDLVQATGVREVTSRSGQLGIPIAGAGAAT
jgi:hypothetical protein